MTGLWRGGDWTVTGLWRGGDWTVTVWERGAVAFRPQGRRWERDWVGSPGLAGDLPVRLAVRGSGAPARGPPGGVRLDGAPPPASPAREPRTPGRRRTGIPGDPAILPGGNAGPWLSGRVLLGVFLDFFANFSKFHPPPPQRLHPGGVTYGTPADYIGHPRTARRSAECVPAR